MHLRRLRLPKLRSVMAGQLASLLLLLSGIPMLSSYPAQARQDAALTTDTLVPIADVLSASSWLLASGLDPRAPAASAAIGASSLDRTTVLPAPAPRPAATPTAGDTEIVTRQSGAFPVTSQPSLAVSPVDADHLVLGVSAMDLPSVASYVSRDGGETWVGPFQAPYFEQDSVGVGGPAVAFDREGNVFLASLSVGFEELTIGRSQVHSVRSRIVVSRSKDGVTWSDPVSAALSPTETTLAADELGNARGEITTRFLDKPAIAIGPDPRHPDREIIYVAYTEFSTRFSATDAPGEAALSFPRVGSSIQLIRSADGGQTWSDPVPVSPAVVRSAGEIGQGSSPSLQPGGAPLVAESLSPGAGPPAAEGDQVVQGAQPVILSDGVLAVAYLDSTRDGPQVGLARVMVAFSEDGGRTFSEPVAAGVFREIGERPRTSFFRWWGSTFPRVAVGKSDEIYITVTAKPGDHPADDGDITLLRSLDEGVTWEMPAPVAAGSTNASQFFPALAVQPDGTLTAIWADMRDDPSRVGYQIYVSQSRDKGATWSLGTDSTPEVPDLPISSVMSNSLVGFPAGLFLGDQIAIAATDNNVFFAWPDTRLAGPDGPNQQIAFAGR